MISVELVIPLISCQHHFSGVDNDNVITSIHCNNAQTNAQSISNWVKNYFHKQTYTIVCYWQMSHKDVSCLERKFVYFGNNWAYKTHFLFFCFVLRQKTQPKLFASDDTKEHSQLQCTWRSASNKPYFSLWDTPTNKLSFFKINWYLQMFRAAIPQPCTHALPEHVHTHTHGWWPAGWYMGFVFPCRMRATIAASLPTACLRASIRYQTLVCVARLYRERDRKTKG